ETERPRDIECLSLHGPKEVGPNFAWMKGLDLCLYFRLHRFGDIDCGVHMIDLHKLDDGSELECDVCLVGTGIAGLALARELMNTSIRVLLVESGGENGEDG